MYASIKGIGTFKERGDQVKKYQTPEKEITQGQVANTDLNQDKPGATSPFPPSLTRRTFLGRVGGVTAATIAAGVVGLPSMLRMKGAEAEAAEVGPSSGAMRRDQAFHVRHDAAVFQQQLPVPSHPCNGDEALFPNRIGNYSKGLPHNSLGEVHLTAYDALIHALSAGLPDDFEAIPLGCPDPARQRKFVNPQAGLAFDLQGTDSHQLAIPPAPAFGSGEEAGEMVELYWMALARDIPFTEYDTSPTTRAVTAELSRISDFRGPKVGGQVTTGTLFRGFTPGDLVGPYISQFLLKTVTFGAEEIIQQTRTVLPGIDYMTQYADWLDIQNGCTPQQSNQFDPTRRFIRNGRDLAAYVHVDVLFQAYFNACLILLEMGAPLNRGNPYNHSGTQVGFGTFGGPHVKALVAEVATRALKAVWYEKWFVHRRLRPEEFGGRVHNHLTGAANYPIHPDALDSQAVQEVFRRNGTYLLPQAYPEGSPLHPSYGAGHATVAGACVTILKAFFDESSLIQDPVVPSPDPPAHALGGGAHGLSLVPYAGPGANSLTVGGELNKLGANISTGRNFAGIHWRADYVESLKLGEAVAISIIRDQRATYNEDFGGFTFTKFDGTTVTV